jgi:hypothetical protein
MGGEISVLNKPYGQSLFGNIYKTKVPVYISWSNCEKSKFHIGEWRDRQWVLNPGLMFIVTDVKKSVGIDSGTHAEIGVRILNDMPIDKNTQLAEAIPNPEYAKKGWDTGDWKYTTIRETDNLVINELMNEDKTMLKLKGLEGSLSEFYFSNRDILKPVNFDEPFEYYDGRLEFITQYENMEPPIIDKEKEKTNNIMLFAYICIPILLSFAAIKRY